MIWKTWFLKWLHHSKLEYKFLKKKMLTRIRLAVCFPLIFNEVIEVKITSESFLTGNKKLTIFLANDITMTSDMTTCYWKCSVKNQQKIFCQWNKKGYPIKENKYGVGEYVTDKDGEWSGIDENHSRWVCVNGRLKFGKIQAVLCSFALDIRLGQKVLRISRITLHGKINKILFEKVCFFGRKCW